MGRGRENARKQKTFFTKSVPDYFNKSISESNSSVKSDSECCDNYRTENDSSESDMSGSSDNDSSDSDNSESDIDIIDSDSSDKNRSDSDKNLIDSMDSDISDTLVFSDYLGGLMCSMTPISRRQMIMT